MVRRRSTRQIPPPTKTSLPRIHRRRINPLHLHRTFPQIPRRTKPTRRRSTRTQPTSQTRQTTMTKHHYSLHETQLHSQPISQHPPNHYFGHFIPALQNNLHAGASELGTAITLFSLAVAIRAKNLLEVGRFKGLSTLALASAAKLLSELTWTEQPHSKQRPHVNYLHHEAKGAHLTSIDKHHLQQSLDTLQQHNCAQFCSLIESTYQNWNPPAHRKFQLAFIDGEHTTKAVLHDVHKTLPLLDSPAYLVLHDVYGWYQNSKSHSPIAKAIQILEPNIGSPLIIDTGYQSLAIYQLNSPEQLS